MDSLDLLAHPVRLRIVFAFSGDRVRTTSDLYASLPDVPRATLYRHVDLLAEGGVLEVADEQRVRGVIERHYRLRPQRTVIDRDAVAAMSVDDHRRAFAAGMAALLAEFNAYLDRPGTDPVADSVGYRQGTVWLSPDELAEMISDLLAALRSRWGNEPAPNRRPHLVSAIFFPTGEPPHHRTDTSADHQH
jgi:DNA-binding transcriptional ArsR family regulator